AELIEGIVYMPSPVSDEHGQMERRVSTWLGVYQAATRGVVGENNTTSFILDGTPQPDLNLRLLPEYGGGSWVEEHYIQGAPELLVEVCASSASYDLHKKYNLYQSAGVPEYLALVVYEREIRWHVLSDGHYQLRSPGTDGLHRSPIFPGLWLDGPALFAGDLRRVLDCLQDGLNSGEHQEFVAKLAAKAGRQ
ncbi:MAG: Uma2 family endonuclease, partial [Pirellulales bacterium]